MVSDVGGTVTLGSGSFTYQKSFALLGLPIKAMITAKPTVIDSGTALEITPTAAAVSGAGATLDGSALLRYLKTVPIQMCTAKYLPVGATIDSVSVVPKTVTLDLSSRGLPLTSSALSSKGRCS